MNRKPPNILLQWLLPIVVVAVGVGYFAFYYFPNSRERANLELQDQQGTNAEAMTQVVLTNLESDQKRLQLMTEAIEESRALLLTEEQAIAMPGHLHKLADATGIRIAQLTPQRSTALETFLQQRYTLRITGTQRQLFAFLYQIETEYPGVRITQFTTVFSPVTQNTSAQLVLETFAGYSEDSD